MYDYRIDFEARDLLFFGDGLQADGSTAGNGVNWPLPSVVNSALIASLHNGLEEDIKQYTSEHGKYNDLENLKKERGIAVRYSCGGVQSLGPFPVKDGKMYVPIPADLQAGKNEELAIMRLIDNAGPGNLPQPLKYLVAPVLPPSKETPGNWISLDDLGKYLNGEANIETAKNSDFYEVERRVGIAINPDTLSTVEGKFYSAEYMRLHSDVQLRVFASYTASKHQGKESKNMLDTAKVKNTFETMMLGGQTGVVCQADMQKETPAFPSSAHTRRLKWILLTPAIFRNGWLPGFLDGETGKIRLKTEVARGNLPRNEWRELVKQASEIDAHLVAARIPKHNYASGWKLNGVTAGQPKPTRRLVPAGSVFYFECASDSDADALWKALHVHSRSDECGEQGFGFGVCGNWNI